MCRFPPAAGGRAALAERTRGTGAGYARCGIRDGEGPQAGTGQLREAVRQKLPQAPGWAFRSWRPAVTRRGAGFPCAAPLLFFGFFDRLRAGPELVAQRALADAEQLGRTGAVTTGRCERALDGDVLEFLEVDRRNGRRALGR